MNISFLPGLDDFSGGSIGNFAGVAGVLDIDNAGLGAKAGLEFSLVVGRTRPSAEFVWIGFVVDAVGIVVVIDDVAVVAPIVVVLIVVEPVRNVPLFIELAVVVLTTGLIDTIVAEAAAAGVVVSEDTDDDDNGVVGLVVATVDCETSNNGLFDGGISEPDASDAGFGVTDVGGSDIGTVVPPPLINGDATDVYCKLTGTFNVL